jgi:hypothetical protein
MRLSIAAKFIPLILLPGTVFASDFSGLAAGFLAPPVLGVVFLYLLIVSNFEKISATMLGIAKIIFSIVSLICVLLIHDAFSSIKVSAIFFISYGAVVAAFVAVLHAHEKQQK